MSKILVIKHGALGDLVLATAAFQAIKKEHPKDHITLLTTPAYVDMMRASGYFDEIWVDTRPKLYHPIAFFGLIEKIRNGGFKRVYDLQTSERTSWYFYLLRDPVPEWVGIANGASHQHNTPSRKRLHTLERHKQQLAIAGIEDVPPPDISWLKSNVGHFHLPDKFALIVAGGSEHRTGKRWPAHNYGTVCSWLVSKGITPVLLGTRSEQSVISTIESICEEARSLLGKTTYFDVAELARHAVFAIGNDTGPMHVIAATGCRSLALFSRFSNPALCAPRGENVSLIQKENLGDLSPETVIDWIKKTINIT